MSRSASTDKEIDPPMAMRTLVNINLSKSLTSGRAKFSALPLFHPPDCTKYLSAKSKIFYRSSLPNLDILLEILGKRRHEHYIKFDRSDAHRNVAKSLHRGFTCGTVVILAFAIMAHSDHAQSSDPVAV